MRILSKPAVARTLTIAAAIYTISYFWWRATASLNPEALLFSTLLLSAELIGGASFLLTCFVTWRTPVALLTPTLPTSNRTAAIVVLVRQESPDQVEAVLVACRQVEHRAGTVVIDTHSRDEIALLARRYDSEYRSVEGADRAVVEALQSAQTDLVAILDGHTVPQPDLLSATLGYFEDTSLAAVQLPLEYYNPDSLQHASRDGGPGGWHDDALLSRVIQPGKNSWDAAAWLGSPSVVRRTALLEAAATLDPADASPQRVSVRLHASGRRVLHLQTPLAFGAAPTSADGYARKRVRWERGAFDLLTSADSPLVASGLSLPRRLCHMATLLPVFDGYQRLVYVLTPIVMLTTGLLPLPLGSIDFLWRWALFFLLANLTCLTLGRDSYDWVRIEQFKYFRMFTFLWTVLTPRRRAAMAQSVAVNANALPPTGAEWRLVLPHLSALAMILATTLFLFLSFFWGLTAIYSSNDDFVIALYWIWTCTILLGIGTIAVLRRRHFARRQTYRFATSLPVTITSPQRPPIVARTFDLSIGGFGATAESNFPRGMQIGTRLELPDGPFTVDGVIAFVRAERRGRQRLGVQFHDLRQADRERLIAYLYVELPRQLSSKVVRPASLLEAPAPDAAGSPESERRKAA